MASRQKSEYGCLLSEKRKMIDLHCHILHDFDDGAKSLDEARKMAETAERDDIKKIVATPHLFRGDNVSGDMGIIWKKLDELRLTLKKNRVNVEIFKGAEVHISHTLIDEIRTNRDHLVINGSSYMILEFPSQHVFHGAKELFFKLLIEGIKPIIAHPERNDVFMRNPGLLYDLVQMGAYTQANSGSFTGHYGKRVVEVAFLFLELQYTHFIGSDAHNPRPNPHWFSDAIEIVEERIGRDAAYALVNDNPDAVLGDKELSYLPYPVDPKENHNSFKIRIPRIFRR